MSTDLIRRAAEMLRERANAATPGPWRDSTATDGIRYGALVADAPHPERPNAAAGGWAWDDGYGGCLVGESLMSADRAYIATMHPGVGLALADLLNHVADDAESNDMFDGFDPWVTVPAYGDALTIARLILGEVAP